MHSSLHDSWLGQAISLFFAPFLHEDVAIVAGAAYVTETGLPWAIALASLFAGIVASDFSIYGLGRAASRIPFLRRHLITERVAAARQWLSEHLVIAVVLSHLIPGTLFPTFVACGWFRVTAWRFMLASLTMAAAYVSGMLFVMIHFGGFIRQSLSYWAWAVLAAVVLGLGTLGHARRASPTFAKAAARLEKLRIQTITPWRREIAARLSHRGMPAIGRLRRAASLAEHIPPGLFYVPLIVQWFLLAARYRSLTLPTVANPLIETGGFWGESKSKCLEFVAPAARKWIAAFVTLRREAEPREDLARALAALDKAGIVFPLVTKPDIGWQGYGVRLIAGKEALLDYLARFPRGETLILQRYLPYDGEAGVYYMRMPGEDHGTITSLTFRYFPYVVGDGQSTLAELILRDPRASFRAATHLGSDPYHLGVGASALERVPAKDEIVRLSFIGSIRVGAVYRDAKAYITPALIARFDEIARAIPEFYVGRFDIRFKSLERLQAGEDFGIIEINGAGSEIIHAWDPDTPFFLTYKILLAQQRLLFRIGALNRARGFRPIPFHTLILGLVHQRRLIESYPPSS